MSIQLETLHDEYGQYPQIKNYTELVGILDNTIVHTLTDEELTVVINSKKLTDLPEPIKEKIAQNLYIDQNFQEKK